VVYSAAYDPYGGIQKTWTSTYTPTLRFSGKERDGESGLDYFGARYYDKAQYRFISVDPIMARTAALFDPQLWHLYSYCRNSPVTFFDPEGKQPIFIRVVRDYYGHHMTLGRIYVDGICFGATYELPYRFNAEYISCIELGLYAAWVARSPKLGYNVTWLEDKNGRTVIEIHPLGDELEGCIGMVSRRSFDELMGYIALRQASSIAAAFSVGFYFPPMIFVSVEATPEGEVFTDYFVGTFWDLLSFILWYFI
jgi:RHS repeat-associated protein